MLQKRLSQVLYLFLLVVLVGVLGYHFIEKWSWFDALYMTIITIASVGYGETNPLGSMGRTFTIFLILIGSGVLVFTLSSVTAYIMEGELSDALRRRRMQKSIDRLNNHYIVCGAGRVGKFIIEELARTGQRFVVIEHHNEPIRTLTERNILYVHGDATHEATLKNAGIARSRGLVAALGTDADNILVTLTAKGLRSDVRVIAKALEPESVEKLRRCGADSVVLPNGIGGMRLASELIRPTVVSFLDTMLRAQDATIRVEEINIPAHSPYAGKCLEDTGLLEMTNVTVTAYRVAPGAPYVFNPPHCTTLDPGCVLIVIGHVDRINAMRDLAEGIPAEVPAE